MCPSAPPPLPTSLSCVSCCGSLQPATTFLRPVETVSRTVRAGMTGAGCGSIWATLLGPGAADGQSASARCTTHYPVIGASHAAERVTAQPGLAARARGRVGPARCCTGGRLVWWCAAEEGMSYVCELARALATCARHDDPGGTNTISVDRPGSPSASALGHGGSGRAVGPAQPVRREAASVVVRRKRKFAHLSARVTLPARQERRGRRRCWRPAPAPHLHHRQVRVAAGSFLPQPEQPNRRCKPVALRAGWDARGVL